MEWENKMNQKRLTLENEKLVELMDIMPGLPMHLIDSVPFGEEIKREFEYPAPNTKIFNKFLKLINGRFIEFPFKISSFSDEPKFFFFCSYPSKESFDIGEIGGGTDENASIAMMKSMGEAIERYSLQKIHPNLEIRSYEDLNKKENAINLEDFINFSESFLNEKREDYLKKISKEKIRWVIGKDSLGKEIKIPAQLVYVPSSKNIFLKEPLIRWPISTGAAFGIMKNGADSKYRGILECIERDSSMINYFSKKEAEEIELDTPKTKELIKDFKRYNLSIRVFNFTTDLGIPSVAAFILDETGIGPAQSVGAKADLNPEKAVIGAIMEAFTSRFALRFRKMLNSPKEIKKPSEIIDLSSRTLFWYERNKRKNLDFLMKNKKKIFLSKMKNHDERDFNKNLKLLVKKLSLKGYEIYFVDLTPKEVEKVGFRVIKSLVPKLHPLFLDERKPHLFSERIKSYGGIRNNYPHPFP